MNQHYRDTRKIDPTKGAKLDDGNLNDNDRIEIGPTLLAYQEWEEAGLALPDLEAMREFRWKRLIEQVVKHDMGGLLMFDPLIFVMPPTAPTCSYGTPTTRSAQCCFARMAIW